MSVQLRTSSCLLRTTAAFGVAVTLIAALGLFTTAAALPRPASGANCSSNWVNNAAAMACFTKGEEEGRAGVKHPHYVACLAGAVYCCVDDDRGQDCEVAEAGGRPAGKADWVRALLAAHKARAMSLGHWYSKPAAGEHRGKVSDQMK